MKKFVKLYAICIITFLGVHITPAAIAAILTLSFNTYMDWVTAPMYHAIWLWFTVPLTVAVVSEAKDIV